MNRLMNRRMKSMSGFMNFMNRLMNAINLWVISMS